MTLGDFVQKWKRTDFNTYNEMDVREEFVRPLLYFLGYSKNTINDIVTEKELALSDGFQRIGRKKVRIDYVPTIRLKAFWILEVKSGTPKEMDNGDMLQAYLYATHPEIQASFIVLCNGWELKIYDVHNYSEWEKPIFTIDHKNCDLKIEELREVLGAESILDSQRRFLLKKIRNTFEVEVEETQLNEFSRRFEKDKRELRGIIRENAKQLWRNEFERRNKLESEKLKELDVKSLILHLDSYGTSNMPVNEYLDRIEKANPEERAELLTKLSHYYGAAKAVFKCRYLGILIYILENEWEIAPLKRCPDVMEEIKKTIRNNLEYWPDSEFQNALCFLDRAFCKAAAIVMKNTAMDYCARVADYKKNYLPKNERTAQFISTSHEILPLIFCTVETLWLAFLNERNPIIIYKYAVMMDKFADELKEQIGVRDYPEKDHDLFHFEDFGNHMDYLHCVTCNIIRSNQDILRKAGVDRAVIDKAITSICIPPINPEKIDEPSDDEKKAFVVRCFQAFAMGCRLYEEIKDRD